MAIPLGRSPQFYILHIVDLIERKYLERDFTLESLPDKVAVAEGLVRVTRIYDLCDPTIIKFGNEYQPGKLITGRRGEPLGIHALRDIAEAAERIPSASYKIGGMQEFFRWLEEAHGRKPTQPPNWDVLRSQIRGHCLDTSVSALFGKVANSPPDRYRGSKRRGRSNL